MRNQLMDDSSTAKKRNNKLKFRLKSIKILFIEVAIGFSS